MLPKFGNGLFLLIFVTGGAFARSFSDRGDFLGRLLNSKSGPVVVFLEPAAVQKNNYRDYDDKTRYNTKKARLSDDSSYKPEAGENEAYLLYGVLRSTQENEVLDPSANRTFEKTKDILRSAFALRCQRRESCEQKCPPKKKEGCQLNCQKVFDELDACDDKPKDTCKKDSGPKCGGGKTMPPKWLRMLLEDGDSQDK